MDEREPLPSMNEVVAAGVERARRGGREVVLPGGMGIALIEQLEQEAAVETDASPVVEPAASDGATRFGARIDAARDRLKAAVRRNDDE